MTANETTQSEHSVDDDQIAWGARAIGAVINRAERQTSRGVSPVKKIAGRYAATKGALRRTFRVGEGA
jgi:hypothetical protein